MDMNENEDLPAPPAQTLQSIIERLRAGIEAAARREAEYAEWRARIPPPAPCPMHGLPRAVDETATRRAWFAGAPALYVRRCPECAARKRLERAGVPLRYLACRLDNFQPADGEERALVERLREIAAGWRARRFDCCAVILHGRRPRCGKTHLAVGLFATAGVHGSFIEEYTLFQAVRDGYETREKRATLRELQRTPFLVLDAVGTALDGRDVSQVMYALFDWRVNRYLPTVVTSNLAPPALAARWGPQTIARLEGAGCAQVTLKGAAEPPNPKP